MMKIKRHDTKSKSYGIKGLLFASLTAISMILILSLIFSILATSSENPGEKTDLYALFALVLAGIFSGFINSKVIGHGKTILSSAFTALVMLLSGIIVSGGMVAGGAFMNYASFIGTSIVGSYLGKRREKRMHKRHR